MSKNLILPSLLLFASVSFAQIKIGLMGGPQSASIKETNSIANWDSTTGRYNTDRAAFHLGVTAEIPLGAKSHLYFEPAILYTEKGNKFSKYVLTARADSVFAYNTKKSLALKYLDIPLNLTYKWRISRKKENNFIVSAGPYISLFSSGNRSTNQNDQLTVHSNTTNITANKTEDVKGGNDADTYNKFGYGLNARTGLSSEKVSITAFYSIGLDNLYHASYTGNFKHKVFGISLSVWLTSFDKTKDANEIKDKDDDGIPDNVDGCPLQAGAAITNGCPDTDGDGTADNVDKCPDTAGLAKYNGCPIPDTDKDGINDEEDKCPGVAGRKDNGGCLTGDTNQDGVIDEKDKKQETADSTGKNEALLSDTTNTGIIDEKNRLQDSTDNKVKNDNQVISEANKNLEGATDDNILFSTNSAKLFAKSITSLKSVVSLLKENPAMTLKVDGYTDNTGTNEANMIVAARRAMAVKNFFIKNGIDGDRIITNAYGSVTPVANNKTVSGRAKNRRVELSLQ